MNTRPDWLNPHAPQQQPRVVYVPVRRRRRPPRRFRWWIVGVIATVCFFAWLSAGLAGPVVSWDELLTGALGIDDPGRLTELATLGCMVVAGLLTWKVLKRNKEDSE